MKTYTVTYESDYGAEIVELEIGDLGYITANLRHVARVMATLYPDAVGSDAYCEDEDGNEYPLDW